MELQLSTHSELPAELPREHLVFHTQDLDEARDKVARIYTSHGLDFKSRRGKLDTWFYHLPMRSASVNYLGYGSDMVVNPGELESFFLIQTPLKGGGDVVCGKQHIITSPLRSSVLNPTLPSKMVWDADCWQTQVRLDRSLVERCLSEMLEKPLAHPVEFDLGMDMSSDPGQVWWNTVQFVADEIPRLKTLPGTDMILKQLEQLLANTLLQIQSHNYSAELAQQKPNLAPRHVKKAEHYIETHSHEALTMGEIVTASGVSERTLYQGFKQFRGLSPMRYLKHVRLQKVHAALKKAAPDDCVTRIASDQGFTQLGRFSVEYREKYGVSPSDTLKN